MSGKKQDTKLEIEPVSDEVLAEVIRLARLDPDDPTMPAQKEHLRRILDHFKVLSKVGVEGLSPTIMINRTPIPLRPDEVGESLDSADALSNASLRAEGFFQAPRILGGEEEFDHG